MLIRPAGEDREEVMAAAIRPVARSDAEAIRDIYGPIVEETTISFETSVPSAADIRNRIDARIDQYPWLVCERDDRVCGCAMAKPHADRDAYLWTVGLSVYVREQARREGIGSALYTALLAILRLQGYVQACAVIALPNEGSVRFHEQLGFEPVGVFDAVGYKHGDWHDVGWWQLPIRPASADPDQPTPVIELVDTPKWQAALAEGNAELET